VHDENQPADDPNGERTRLSRVVRDDPVVPQKPELSCRYGDVEANR
jgi:hypothetical protein